MSFAKGLLPRLRGRKELPANSLEDAVHLVGAEYVHIRFIALGRFHRVTDVSGHDLPPNGDVERPVQYPIHVESGPVRNLSLQVGQHGLTCCGPRC